MSSRPTLVAALAVAVACRHPTSAPTLHPAGSDMDDGTGLLYQASIKYETGGTGEPDRFADDDRAARGYTYGDEYGGYRYGGNAYGGSPYGGVSYAGWQPYGGSPVNRLLDYTIQSLADAGAVAGTVTWAAAPGDRRLRSPCGDIDNPSLRLGAHGEAGGAIVYLDQIAAGRPLAMGNKPLAIGGNLEKLGCALRPTAQVVSPAPAVVTIYNDAQREVAIVSSAGTAPVKLPLAPGGHRQVGVARGVTVIADAAGRLVPGWVVTPGHPYFAITDDGGRFRIDDVVPGTYKLVIWHAPVVTGWAQGKVQYGAAVTLTRTIKVGANTTTRQDVALE